MVAIETAITPEQALKELRIWYPMQEQLRTIKTAEIILRKRIVGVLFPEPREGSNTRSLDDGYELVLIHSIDRAVDDAALTAAKEKLRKQKIPVDDLFVYKPELVTKAYRKLTDKQRAAVDALMTIKPGSPQVFIRAENAPRIPDPTGTPDANERPAARRASKAKGKRK